MRPTYLLLSTLAVLAACADTQGPTAPVAQDPGTITTSAGIKVPDAPVQGGIKVPEEPQRGIKVPDAPIRTGIKVPEGPKRYGIKVPE